MPVEKEIFDMRPHLDLIALNRIMELLVVGPEPTPEMMDEAVQLFTNANSITRLKIYQKMSSPGPIADVFFRFHKKVGMLLVNMINAKDDPILEKYLNLRRDRALVVCDVTVLGDV
jgi:hypothetical protein